MYSVTIKIRSEKLSNEREIEFAGHCFQWVYSGIYHVQIAQFAHPAFHG